MKLAAVLGLSLTGVAVAQNITTVFTNDTQLIYSRPGTNSGVRYVTLLFCTTGPDGTLTTTSSIVSEAGEILAWILIPTPT